MKPIYPIAFAISCILVLLSSCFEEDSRVPEYPYTVYTISDSVQLNRSYFDFESASIVKVHKNDIWQLAFECGVDGNRILTNSEAYWLIYNTHQKTSGSSVQMPPINASMYDIPGLWPDSTAVGTWFSTKNSVRTYSKNIYLMGKVGAPSYQEVKEIVFLELTDTSYTFSYHDRSMDTYDTILIPKSNDVNFVYYSFETGRSFHAEPPKTDYDLIFTSWYDMATLFSITQPYHVGGSLLNVYSTEGALDSITPYEAIDLGKALETDFSSRKDIPGYKWKDVNVDISSVNATYKVKPHYTYLFKTREGNYFKLRFLSYSLQGKSGFPQFEFVRLE